MVRKTGRNVRRRGLNVKACLAGDTPLRADREDDLMSGRKSGWSGSPLHMAAATGRADVVQQLLLAGVSPLAWSPGSSQ